MPKFSLEQFLKELRAMRDAETFEQLRKAEQKAEAALKKLEMTIKKGKKQPEAKESPLGNS